MRHLVDKETAAKDVISDYERRGNILIQRYGTERREHLETDNAGMNRSLANVYSQTQSNLRKISKDMNSRSTRTLEDRVTARHRQQERLSSAIDKAIAACVQV